ncbi:hypothetical protein [Nocardioides speluncae]|uniref:hypothetical protein n=1 Tax=Nocardioides speluncae TaxID=2670337 RepID=UPI0012B1776A|nr:hypothetical protein [Nocardioides speluncae]
MSARAVCRCGWSGTYSSRARAEAMGAKHVCKMDDGVRRATRRHRCARCGLEAVYENAGATEARYWFNKHSCRKRELAMLRAAEAALREALIDRTPKPCLHKAANHQHSTRACYVLDKCRCKPCSRANCEAETWRERQKAYGRYNKYVPAGPVREHVRTLADAGMGLKQVAKISGVPNGTLWKLMYGKRQPDGSQIPSRRALRETAEKLFALDPDWNGPLQLADGAVLSASDSSAASRKLQALIALGWSMSQIGRRLGMEWSRNAHPVIKGERCITVATARKADALYAELWETPPPETNQRERIAASRSRNYAEQHGWGPLIVPEVDEVESGAGRWVTRRGVQVWERAS